MLENWGHSADVRVDKHARDVFQALEEATGEDVEVKKSSVEDGEYALATRSIENLVLTINGQSIAIIDISARSPGQESGTHMVQALIDIAKDLGCQLRAENVKPERNAWWRRMGFSPPEGQEHSADYTYKPQKSS